MTRFIQDLPVSTRGTQALPDFILMLCKITRLSACFPRFSRLPQSLPGCRNAVTFLDENKDCVHTGLLSLAYPPSGCTDYHHALTYKLYDPSTRCKSHHESHMDLQSLSHFRSWANELYPQKESSKKINLNHDYHPKGHA